LQLAAVQGSQQDKLAVQMNGQLLRITAELQKRDLISATEARRFMLHWQLRLTTVQQTLLFQTVEQLRSDGGEEEWAATADVVKDAPMAAGGPIGLSCC